MPYKSYDDNPFDDYQGYDQYGSDIEALMNRLIGQQRMIQSTIKDEIDRTRTQITQTADEIRQDVEDFEENVNSTIQQLADEIDLRVTKEDYNGEEIISRINISPEGITIAANRINFEGAIFGEEATFTGNISTEKSATVGKNLYVGPDFSDQEDKTIYMGGIGGPRITRNLDSLEVTSPLAEVIIRGVAGVHLRTTLDDPITVNDININSADLIKSGEFHPNRIPSDNKNGRILVTPFGQDLEFYKDTNTGRIVVRENGQVIGALEWNNTA